MTNRDLTIDFLRFVGLSLIILVHVNPPQAIIQFRCFDVPLMVFISGLTASKKEINDYFGFVFKRTKRLLIPVWIFLFFYLTTLYFVQFKITSEQYLTWNMIWRSFLLLDQSIGYVWIIRVFLLVMLITPILQSCINYFNRIIALSFLIIILLFIIELLYHISLYFEHITFIKFIFQDILLYTISYSVFYLLGLRLRYSSYIERKNLLIFSIILCIIALFFYMFQYGLPIIITPIFKEPPHSYYIIYGIFFTVLIWFIKPVFDKLSNNSLFTFIGQNTIWIYLWHMPLVLVSSKIHLNWSIKYFFVYFLAISIFFVQYNLVKKIKNKTLTKYFLG